MSSQKCPNCGLTNWSDEPECKRCKAPQQPQEETYGFQPPRPIFKEEKPATALGILMVIWGALTLIGGLYLLTFNQVSHVLALGSGTLVSGVSLTRGRRSGMALYFLGIVVMVFWACSQGRVGLAIGTSLYTALIGLLVTKRRLPVLAGVLIVLSCFGMVGALAIPTLMRPARVAWREFQPSEGMFDIQMPAEPVKRDPVVESLGGGLTLTKNTYEATVRGQGSALYIIVEFSPALPLVDTSIYEKALEAELTTLANNTHSTVRSKDKITVNGYHGLSYTLNPPKNLALDRPFSTGKIIINSNYLYVMHLTASESSELREGMDKFLTPRALIELTSGK